MRFDGVRDENDQRQGEIQNRIDEIREVSRIHLIGNVTQTSCRIDRNQIEEEKVWQATDDDLQRRQDAKDYLMRMVDSIFVITQRVTQS